MRRATRCLGFTLVAICAFVFYAFIMVVSFVIRGICCVITIVVYIIFERGVFRGVVF